MSEGGINDKPTFMKRQNRINSPERTHDITPDEVRRFEKFRHYTDDQVAALIDTIKKYSRFIYNVVSKSRKSGKKIALQIDNQDIKAA